MERSGSGPGEEARSAGPEDSAGGRRRFVDQLDPLVVKILTVLGFGIPAIGYFWVVVHYSVNVIKSDQLSDVTVIQASYSHFIPWGAIWVPHNEARLLFPNLIVILLAHTVHFNIRIEEFLGAIMLLASTVLFIWAHRRRAPATPWLYYCPVALLSFSLVQAENTLWGFQMAWFLTLLCLAAAVFLLDRTVLTWPVLILAMAAAVVGSYSLFQGLLIWPVGLVLFYHRRRALPMVAAWIVAAVVTTVFFFHKLGLNTRDSHWALHHPVATIKYFFYEVGSVLGHPVGVGVHHENWAVMVFGVVITVLAVAAVIAYGIRRDEDGAGPVGVAMICMGLLFAATVAEGRSVLGYSSASASRYTTFNLLILVGLALTLLGRPNLFASRNRLADAPGQDDDSRRRWQIGTLSPRSLVDGALPVVRWLAAIAIAIQILVGLSAGSSEVQAENRHEVHVQMLLGHSGRLTGTVLKKELGPYYSVRYIRGQIKIEKERHLSSFSAGSP